MADSKACQNHLKQREKKHQDGMLRQASTTNCSASSSTICYSAKKKGPVTQPFQGAPTPPSTSPFLFASTSSPFSSSSVTSIKPNTGVELLVASAEPKTEVELVLPPITYKEEEEDMAANLRARFKERQHKSLSKSITVIIPPYKRPCPKILCSELILTFASVIGPSVVAAGTNPMLDERLFSAEGSIHLEPWRPSSGPEQLNDDSIECVAFIPSRPQAPRAPSREDIVEMMKQIPSFIEREALVHNMGILFSIGLDEFR